MDVYLLWHEHVLGEGESDDKLIGVYSTKKQAEEALATFRTIQGFRDYPDGFTIDQYRLDKNHWTEGFTMI